MSKVVALNNLQQQPNQVYGASGGGQTEFDYSDGDQVERYLHKVLSSARDLGTRSRELQQQIIDWPSEYHLSSDRANLLRPYELSGIANALEFGSGCGAISRYLGELGIEVDAIEGSPIRAELGKLRCRDLDNVNVIQANYNALEIPRSYYDLVLFVGVIEYARKFHTAVGSDLDAAIAILGQAREYLNPGGVVLVAIENRLGLKYILGHHEDHYAKRYIGIHGYPDSAGIATYSDSEWRRIIEQAGFEGSRLTYPFPDYKIPRVTLAEEFVRDNPYAFNHLEGIFARDYTQPETRGPMESLAWQAASAGGFVEQIANSFCLVMGDSRQAVDRFSPLDFCHMPGPGRKNQYAVVTGKRQAEEQVFKTAIPIISSSPSQLEGEVSQQLTEQPYLHGNLLSTEWLRTILIYARREEFEQLLEDYWTYLESCEAAGELAIDLLPINIIVDKSGAYRSFDQEWQVAWPITREYLLFRALLTFIVDNWIHVREFLNWLELNTVREFIDHGFRHLNLVFTRYEAEFVARENKFQSLTTENQVARDVGALLATAFDFSREDSDLYATLHWDRDGGGFDTAAKATLKYTPTADWQTLEFDLPDTVRQLHQLRLDPFDNRKTADTGFYSVREIAVLEENRSEQSRLWALETEQDVARASKTEGAYYQPLADSGSWLSVTGFPKLGFTFPQALEITGQNPVRVKVVLKVARTPDYILAHKLYLAKVREAEQRQSDHEELTRQLRGRLDSANAEIAAIKQGKPFRLGMKIFSLLTVFRRP